MGSNARRVILLSLAVACLLAPTVLFSATAGAARNRAGVVIEISGKMRRDCVGFRGDQTTGLNLLRQSKFRHMAAQFEGLGRAVCWIDGKGCKTRNPDDCFCRPNRYWNYWTQEPGTPTPQEKFGAQQRVVTDGAVDYWKWAASRFPDPQPPPRRSFTIDQICKG